MKQLFTTIGLIILLAHLLSAQVHEAGISLGTATYLGDLGRMNPARNNYFSDVAGAISKPAGQVFYRYTFNQHLALRAGLAFTQIAGDDRLSEGEMLRDAGWYRNYRNLHFKSFLLEVSTLLEFNVLKYKPGSLERRWTPYFFGGIALFAFNPKAEYNGQWVALQPLGTEGQGLDAYPNRKKYSRVQPAVPLGMGIKFNVTQNLVLSAEIGHRITFTDYMDDVSSTYVSQTDFAEAYNPQQAALVYGLSRRSIEQDVEGHYAKITAEGEFRGNAKRNDAFMFTSFSVAYVFGQLKGRPTAPETINMGSAFY